jgi:hypothetical protein
LGGGKTNITVTNLLERLLGDKETSVTSRTSTAADLQGDIPGDKETSGSSVSSKIGTAANIIGGLLSDKEPSGTSVTSKIGTAANI